MSKSYNSFASAVFSNPNEGFVGVEESLKDRSQGSTTRYLPTHVAQAGPLEQLKESFSRGIDESLISGILPDVLARKKAASLDEEFGLKPLTKDQFEDKGFGMYGDAFEHQPSETPSQTQLRFNRFIKRVVSQENTSGGGTAQKIANFGAEFAGGLTGDVPVAAVPYTAFAARIGVASKALQSGWKQASAQAATQKFTRAAAYESALASGSRLKVAGLVSKDFFKESLIASTVETGLWGAGEKYVGGDVTGTDLLLNQLFSVGMSSPFAFFGVRRAFKEQDKVLKFNQDIDSVSRFLEDGQTTEAAFKLADFYEPAKKIAKENKEFSFLLQDIDDITKLTPDQVDAAARFQQMVTIEELKKSVANQALSVLASDAASSSSQEELAGTVAEQIERIYNSIDNNQHLTLADEDWQVLVKSGWDPSPEDLAFRNQWENSQRQLELDLEPDIPSNQLTEKFTERFSTLLERIKTEKHQTSGDNTFKEFAEAAKSGFLIYEGKKIPVSEETLDRVAQVYEDNLDAWKNAPDENKDYNAYLEFLKSSKNTEIIDDIYRDTIGQARATSRGLGQITSAADGKLLPQLAFEWSGKLKVGDVYENIDLCGVTSGRCSFDLRMSGLPSTFVSIGQMDTTGATKKLGSHKVAVTEVNGKRYIVDHPQKELWEPLNPPKANAGRVLTTEFKPRFIEVTPENLKKYYGDENSSTIDRLLKAKLKESTVKSQLNAKFTSARYSKNGYELSSSGDARFSAFRARLKDGRTVEKAYQEAKGSGKGQPAKDSNFDYYGTYLKIWKQWAKENPDLIEDLRQKAQGKVLTDKFANTENNQARALADILNETQPTQPIESGQLANVIYKKGTAAVRAAEASGEGINVLRKQGTDEHYGNPFSHLGYKGTVKTAGLQETVDSYRSWLEGTNHADVNQAQRQWILTQIDSGALDGKKLLYYDESVQPNHATALAEFIEARRGVKSKPLTKRGKDFVNHSGGARGADDVWGTIGEEYGITSRHYYVEGNKTPKGNTPVTQEQAKAADSALDKANETLQRTFPTSNTYVNNLLRRNYYQVVNSDAVFAITELDFNGVPQGGTGWAVQMAVDMGKPVAVFSQDMDQWFSWDSASDKWWQIDTPTLTKNFAGIGTRNLNTVGKKAIKEVYTKTFQSDVRTRFSKIGNDPNQFAGAAMLLPELGFKGKVTLISEPETGFKAQYNPGSKKITFNLAHFGENETAISSALHEFVHHLASDFKPAYQKILDVVNNNARLRDQIFTDGLWRQYNTDDLADYFNYLRSLGEDTNDPKVKRKAYDWADERHREEGVAWFVTEASRHNEFWKGMHAADPKLFNELRDWFVAVWQNLIKERRLNRSKLTDRDRKAFYEVGLIIGAINNSGVSKPISGAGSLDPTLTHQNFKDVKKQLNETFNSEQIDKPEPQQSELALEAEETLNRNLNESGSLNNDRSEFFINETNTVLGNPTVLQTILSTPEGYNAANDKGAVARKAHVRTVLEQNGLENYSDIAETIIDIASRKDFQESLINDIFDGSSNYFQTADLNVKGLSEELKTSIRILLSESNDMSTARTRVLQSLNETFDAEVLRAVRNGKIQNEFIAGANQFKNPKQRIEWIQSQLDGQQRSGFNPQASANVKSKAQIVVDAKPINDVLEKHGLWDVFIGAGHGPYLEVLRKQTGGNPDAIKIYGKDLRANVNEFAADLMVAMRTGETPAKWKGSEAFEELVDAIKKVRDSQLVALNRFGSNVRVLDNFSGWSQRWSNATIKQIGFDQFRKDMLAGIDWDATSRAHGDVLTRENGKDIPFDREAYLKEWYYRITELKETLEGGDVARSFEQSRMVHLKADSEAKLLAKYSGEGNLGKLLMDQIRYRSEMIASLGFFGSEPLTTIQKTLDAADLRRGDNVGKFKYDTVLGTTKLLINELDNPVDASFASIFKNVRKVGNLAFLPLSGFSALMDIPLSVSTLKYTGAEIGVNEFMPQFIEAMSRQFKGDKSGMTAYFRDVGAAYDVVNNANVRQITGDVSGEKGLLDIAMSFMFEANGMLRITAAGQEAFADWTSRSLGKDAASGKFNDMRLESLRNFGFTDAEIGVLLKSASKEAPDGISRVMPQTVEDANVSNKLREYYLHYMKQAILEPDAGAQAITRGNFKSGTVGGEVMRTGFQYTSFILGLSRVIFNRFANGYTGSQLNHVRAMSHLVAFVGTSLATAWFVTVMKDLSKGRAPINPMNMSSFEWQRILSQSGLVGIGEIPLELLEGSLPVSPIAKAPIDLAAGVLGRDGKKTAKAIAPFAGGSLPIVGGPIKSMLGMAFTESAGSIVEAEFEYLQKF